MKTIYWSAFPVALAALALSGCGLPYFAPPKSQPVIRSYISEEPHEHRRVVSLATTAERRNIFHNLENGRTCFEPPAEVAEAISANFAAALEGSFAQNERAAAELGTNFASAISSLSQRSQGILFFRDAVFNLCLQYMNEVIPPSVYAASIGKFADEAVALIKLELQETDGRIGPESLATLGSPAIGSALREAAGSMLREAAVLAEAAASAAISGVAAVQETEAKAGMAAAAARARVPRDGASGTGSWEIARYAAVLAVREAVPEAKRDAAETAVVKHLDLLRRPGAAAPVTTQPASTPQPSAPAASGGP